MFWEIPFYVKLKFHLKIVFTYLFLAVPGLYCYTGSSLVAVSWGYSLVLIAVAPLVAEHGSGVPGLL